MRVAGVLVGAALSVAVWGALANGGDEALSVPTPRAMDACPVCGMLVSKFPSWTAAVVWKDGHNDYFDGAKDLFKFLQALPKYAPGRTREAIRFIAVTDYYDIHKIEAGKAFYVTGSDVLGPMGYELVPLATRTDAEEFLKDHAGKRILRYSEVTPDVVKQVDAGQF